MSLNARTIATIVATAGRMIAKISADRRATSVNFPSVSIVG